VSIAPIAAGIPSLPSPFPTNPTGPTDAAGSFAEMVGNGLENLQSVQANADSMAQQAATGDLTDLHDYMIASSQASLATELTVAVRNRAVESFNDIMRMQV
jgi:flagellar hook-basal body complex protein FliE